METTVLVQGQILPPAQPAPERANPLSAMTFQHGDRPLVRLVAESLEEAEQLTLATLGVEFEQSHTVGSSIQRAVGFPAWPIMHDPDNAKHALNLVGDLEWARRMAGSQAKKVKERFDALTTTLMASAPHFVPTLLEELSRIFHDVDNSQYAKQYFSKAREVERAYALPVDPQRHREVFIEFAVAGVLSARELTTEASAAFDRFADPQEAFDYLLDINVERVRAGVEPYAYLARDLRKAGARIGLQADEVDDKILESIIELKAFEKAPQGFFKAIRKSLIRYAKQHPESHEALLKAEPYNLKTADYIAILLESGVVTELRKTPEEHATWLIQRLNDDSGWKEIEQWLLSEIEFAGERIRGKKLTNYLWQYTLNVLDLLAHFGCEFDYSKQSWRGHVDWSDWYEEELDATRRPLVDLAAHPKMRQLVIDALRPEDVGRHLDLLLAHEGARELLLAKVELLIAERNQAVGSIPANEDYLQKAKYFASPKLRAVVGDRLDELFAFDASKQFQQLMHRGTAAEYSWPAFEQSVQRLREKSGKKGFYTRDSYPAVAVLSGKYVEVIDGNEVIAAGEIPDTTRPAMLVQNIGDQVMVAYDPPNSWKASVYWLGSSAAVATGNYLSPSWGYTFPVAGGRLIPSGLLTVGKDSGLSADGGLYSVDPSGVPAFRSQSHWFSEAGMLQWDGSEMSAWKHPPLEVLDALGIRDMGLDFTGVAPDAELLLHRSVIIPAQPTTQHSPFGLTQTAHISLMFREKGDTDSYFVVGSNGSFEVGDDEHVVLQRPGGGLWIAAENNLYDLDSRAPIAPSQDRNFENLDIHDLDMHCWHQLQARDLTASIAMREYTTTQAADVIQIMVDSQATIDQPDAFVGVVDQLEAAINEIEHALGQQNNDADDAKLQQLRELLMIQLRTSNTVLVDAVTVIALSVARLARTFGQYALQAAAIGTSQANPHEPALQITSPAGEALNNFMGSRYENMPELYVAALRKLAGFIADPSKPISDFTTIRDLDWFSLPHNERLIIAWLGSPYLAQLLGEDAIRDLVAFFKSATEAGIFGSNWRKVRVEVPAESVESRLLPESVVEGAFVISNDSAWIRPGEPATRHIWVPDSRETIDGFPVQQQEFYPLAAEQFVAALEAIEQHLVGREVNAEAIATIAESTAVTAEALTFAFGGMINLDSWEANFLSAEQRAIFGFNAIQGKSARVQVNEWGGIKAAWFAAAVNPDNPVDYVLHGPDAAAVVAAWKQHMPSVALRLTTEEYWKIQELLEFRSPGFFRRLLESVAELERQGSCGLFDLFRLCKVLLWLGEHCKLNDSRRPAIAEKLEWLRRAIAEQFAQDKTIQKHIKAIEFGADYSRVENLSPLAQGLRPLHEGLLDQLVADYQHVYDEKDGFGQDPLISVPDVVAEASAVLEVDQDAARYFLQLLALAFPSDANIRLWNGWRKKNIDHAASQLLERGLVLEAKRSGASRSRFILGGWLPGATGTKPLEVWKAGHYLLWKDAATRSILPLLFSPVPWHQLYQDVWERYTSGDVPGYEELKTARYRARRR